LPLIKVRFFSEEPGKPTSLAKVLGVTLPVRTRFPMHKGQKRMMVDCAHRHFGLHTNMSLSDETKLECGM
jgi:hypothetical protein